MSLNQGATWLTGRRSLKIVKISPQSSGKDPEMATVATYHPSRPYVPQVAFYTLYLVILIIPVVFLGMLLNPWIALAPLIFGVVAPLLQGLVNIPANPPYRGVPTFLGQRYPGALSEGWHIRLGFPWLYGLVPVNVERNNLDFEPENVRTPDTAELKVPISVTYTPTSGNLLAFLNTGAEAGVENILRDIAGEAIREWASSADHGPKTWREAYGAHAEALPVVVNALVGRAVDARLSANELARMRGGNGALESVALGITLNRVNITQIQVLGELAKAAEQQAVEKAQRAGEIIERNFLAKSLEILIQKGLTPEEARRAFQIERKKITETVETKVFGVTPETFKAAGEAIAGALGRGKDGEGGEQS